MIYILILSQIVITGVIAIIAVRSIKSLIVDSHEDVTSGIHKVLEKMK